MWDKYCGDKDLYEKFEFAQLHKDGKPIEEPKILSAISKYDDGLWINTAKWSYPMTQLTDDECWLKIPRGTVADSIKLIKRKNKS